MKKNHNRFVAGLVAICLVMIVAAVGLTFLPKVGSSGPDGLTIATLYISPVQIPWSAANHDGIGKALKLVFPDAKIVEDGENFRVIGRNGKEIARTLSWTADKDFSGAEATRVAVSMINQGADLVLVTAENWCEDIAVLAKNYPKINFMCTRSSKIAQNLGAMYPKSWEGFCSACAAAARVSTVPTLGLLGAYENNAQVASNHGACAACFAQSWTEKHGPSKIEVKTAYVNSWSNPADEATAAQTLAYDGVGAMADHQDGVDAAKALCDMPNRPITIGYDSDWTKWLSADCSESVLTSVLIDWTGAYLWAIRGTLEGNFRGIKWNPGMEILAETGRPAVSLAPFSPLASSEARAVADEYARKLIGGWRPCGDDNVMWSLDHWTKCWAPGQEVPVN